MVSKISDLKNEIDEAELILIGIGDEFADIEEKNGISIYNNIAKLILNKNYFVVSMCEDDNIFKSDMAKDKITAPFCDAAVEDSNKENQEDPQWEKYMMWLSCTLNKKLLIIELGASIMNPQVIRWPFEKIVELNNKAKLIRVNAMMPNVPSEISGKCISIKASSVDFCKD